MADLVKNYSSDQTVAQGEDFDPTPANIEKRVKRSELGTGIKVALLPRKSRGNQAVAVLNLHYGNEKSLKASAVAARFLGILMLRGTRKHTRQQIQDELNKIGAQIQPMGGLGELTFMLQCKRVNLPVAIRLLGEIIREPTLPPEDFDIMKQRFKVNLERGLTEPGALAARSLQRRLSPYSSDDIRYTPTIPETIARLDKLTHKDVVRLYREQVGAQAAELAIVGDFDPKPTLRQFGEILAGWTSTVRVERIAEPAQTDVKGGREEIVTPDKADAFFMAGLMIALTDTDPAYPALKLGNFIFGSGSLSSRLGDRVRKQEGLSYHIASSFAADSREKSAIFSIVANCNPQNIDKVNKAVAQELALFLKGGVKAQELADAKKGYLLQMKHQWSSNRGLAALLAEGLYDKRTFEYYADLQTKISALTPEAVVQAFRKHIDPARLVIVRAGDFKKEPTKPKAR
jgi:zinc protease